MLPNVKRLLSSGGILLCDNIFFHGIVTTDPMTLHRKNRTIAVNMREFIRLIMEDGGFRSTVLPVGDGLLLAYRLGNGDEDEE